MIDQPDQQVLPPRQITASMASLRREPKADGSQETQMLFGETFHPQEEQDGWVRGFTSFDNYVGYIASYNLSPTVHVPTHRVAALRTYRFSAPDLKSPPLGLVSMNAKLRVEERPENRFVRESRGGWIFANHLAPVAARAEDFVAIAERFLGTPYFWGGRTSLGLDCSALVQNAKELAGISVPRDSGPQRDFFLEQGQTLFRAEKDGSWQELILARGDLVFWNGHVGIMRDPQHMVHANATYMAVTVNNLAEFAERIRASEGDVQAIIRPAPVAVTA